MLTKFSEAKHFSCIVSFSFAVMQEVHYFYNFFEACRWINTTVKSKALLSSTFSNEAIKSSN